MSWCSEFIMQYVLVGLVCRGGLCCTGVVLDFCNQINGCRYNTIYTARLKPGGTPKCFTVRNDGKWLHWTVSH